LLQLVAFKSFHHPVTLADVARRAGVSPATVSNALSRRGRLSEPVAERIRALAREMGYVTGHAGRSLRTGTTRTLGLIVPDFAMPLFPPFAQAIKRAAERRGYAVLMGDALASADGQTREMENLVARGADALVIIPVRGSTVVDSPVPVAIIDSESRPGNTVSSDHREGGRLLARYLIGLGHRSILILAGTDTPTGESSTVALDRTRGMREVFDAAPGVTYDAIPSPVSFEAGKDLARRIDPSRYTAIAATYDALAIGTVVGLVERGIRIPDEMSIAGFDDVVWGQIVSPRLTTIRQDLAAISERAVAIVTGERDDGCLVPVELVVRQSTGAPRRRDPASGASR
jgi:LacI family transcriptional regulator